MRKWSLPVSLVLVLVLIASMGSVALARGGTGVQFRHGGQVSEFGGLVGACDYEVEVGALKEQHALLRDLHLDIRSAQLSIGELVRKLRQAGDIDTLREIQALRHAAVELRRETMQVAQARIDARDLIREGVDTGQGDLVATGFQELIALNNQLLQANRSVLAMFQSIVGSFE